MRKAPFLRLLTAGSILLLSGSCLKDHVTKTYTIVRPVFELRSSVLAKINGNPGQAFESPGKIFIKDGYIYLNEKDKGVHIIDNTDPSHPKQVAFLNIPGSREVVVKDNTLYADMFGDLVAIDVSQPRQAVAKGHIRQLFLSNLPPAHFPVAYSWLYYTSVDSNLVQVGWTKKDTTVDDRQANWNSGCPTCMYVLVTPEAIATNSSSEGIAGSMSKMALVGNYLYAITPFRGIGSVDIGQPGKPSLVNSMNTGFGLETLYPFQDKLFAGSPTGVFIYDITNPAKPAFISQYTHGRACDPVVTDGNYAFVTLHTGSTCGGASNELDVVNVENLQQPSLVQVVPMTKPQGLCKDGNLLFVCDDSEGVKVFDASTPNDLKLLTLVGKGTTTYDVIAAGHRLLVVSDKGLYQFDYSDPANIRLLSFFATNQGN